MGGDFNDTNCLHHLSLPPFSCLSQLSIEVCGMLSHMPTFPNLKILKLWNCNVEPLEPTLNITTSKCLVDPPLSMLKSLQIGEIHVKKFPRDWMQNLTSLEHLQIKMFSSQEFQEIDIWFKDNLNSIPSLQKNTVEFCADLKALSDWMCNLLWLQHIKISKCKNLASLPEGMPCLTNLQTLEIIGCPLLVEECQTKTSATWPKIAHIPNIILKQSLFESYFSA